MVIGQSAKVVTTENDFNSFISSLKAQGLISDKMIVMTDKNPMTHIESLMSSVLEKEMSKE
jgi:phage terminase small subunit